MKDKNAKARQFKKNEALNKISKIYNPKYKFPYMQGYDWGDLDDSPSMSEQREQAIKRIIETLESDLLNLKTII